jgi:hypothetical protein
MPLPRIIDYPHSPRFQAEPPQLLAADGALPITVDLTYVVTKGSACLVSVAAPGAANVGRRIQVLSATDFAHVFTFTGSTLRDGTAGAKITWTAPAQAGCGFEFYAASATLWVLQSKNLGTVA